MKAYCPECKKATEIVMRHANESGLPITHLACAACFKMLVTLAGHVHLALAAQVPAESQPIHPTDSAE